MCSCVGQERRRGEATPAHQPPEPNRPQVNMEVGACPRCFKMLQNENIQQLALYGLEEEPNTQAQLKPSRHPARPAGVVTSKQVSTLTMNRSEQRIALYDTTS